MIIPVPTLIGLCGILLCVLLLPFLVKKVEHNLEVFLMVMGALSVTVSGLWDMNLVLEALTDPVKLKHPIVEVVFLSSLLFSFFHDSIRNNLKKTVKFLGFRLFVFLLITLLGLLSSVITAIVASLLLVEIAHKLNLDKKTQLSLVVLSCFSIGLGAALTPVGEPLSTIAISKLKGEPYHAGFFFLFNTLWWLVLPGIAAYGFLGVFLCGNQTHTKAAEQEDKKDTLRDILVRSLKVYVFIMALVFLGKGFQPVIDAYVIKLHPGILYWINSISAVLDNATLTAAEISPQMDIKQIRDVLMGLLIAGGMLIPGNIPNIIAASKLKISSSEWAKLGIPVGLVSMLIFFAILAVV